MKKQPHQCELTFEPQRLFHSDRRQLGKFALCTKEHGSSLFHESFSDISRLDSVLRQIEDNPNKNEHVWISQATLHPYAKNRRSSSISLLNAVWSDIDIKHPPKGFDKNSLLKGDVSTEKDSCRMALALSDDLEYEGLPEPTFIIATGGGLCPKWIFESAIPVVAMARWQSLQKHLNRRIANIKNHLGDYSWAW
ncbi:MAG: hypothetical protein ACOYM1_12275, partial [Methylovulum sp.]